MCADLAPSVVAGSGAAAAPQTPQTPPVLSVSSDDENEDRQMGHWTPTAPSPSTFDLLLSGTRNGHRHDTSAPKKRKRSKKHKVAKKTEVSEDDDFDELFRIDTQ